VAIEIFFKKIGQKKSGFKTVVILFEYNMYRYSKNSAAKGPYKRYNSSANVLH
jgi:hypothetical protein